MLHKHLLTLTTAFIAFSFISCGQSGEKGSADETASIPGAVKETAEFSILVPEGWEFVDFGNAALQTYNKSGSYIVEVKREGLNMTEKDVQSTLEMLRKQYNGSPVTNVEMLGLNFYTTTYDMQSAHQSKYTALKDGQKISITLSGVDHETDATMQAVFNSIKLK